MFGWSIFLGACFLFSLIVSTIAFLAFGVLLWLTSIIAPVVNSIFPDLAYGANFVRLTFVKQCVFSLILVGLAIGVIGIVLWLPFEWLRNRSKGCKNWLLDKLGFTTGFLSDFYLRAKLTDVFDSSAHLVKRNKKGEMLLGHDPFPILLVSVPLQKVRESPENTSCPPSVQIWAKSGIPLIKALRTALAVPLVFSPTHVTAKVRQQWSWWDKTKIRGGMGPNAQGQPPKLDLVDGAVVRANPLPALFDFLRLGTEQAQEIATKLERNNEHHPAIHVVYSVPLNRTLAQRQSISDTETNIIDVATQSFKLSRRRDTQMEVAQTNYISYLENCIRKGSKTSKEEERPFRLFADEIGPESLIAFANPFNPSREEIFSTTATGCRLTLQTLYANELWSFTGPGPIYCNRFLRKMATKREWDSPQANPGLTEICSRCTGELERPLQKPKARTDGARVLRHEGLFPSEVLHKDPKIVFVASGGVFRGAFHVGMTAAFYTCGIRPDLIVGASVGTLIGSALGAICSFNQTTALVKLRTLTATFLHVDDQIALTTTLKNAARELGIQGSTIRLSPSEFARLIRRGSRADAGYAATGAPPALIDAISTLFRLPYRKTSEIAAEFVAGHVTESVNLFGEQVKKETLRQLRVQYALMGTTLLEPVARALLSGEREEKLDLGSAQPFYGPCQKNKKSPLTFFATTTDLGSQSPLLLGQPPDTGGQSYDFIQAILASSAFPGVFAPRRESEIFPGIGNIDIRFADGGMFDNLPFFPAVGILMQWQRDFHKTKEGQKISSEQFLKERHNSPDLFIAGSLNVPLGNDGEENLQFDTIGAIQVRVVALHGNAKIHSFEQAADIVDRQVERLLKVPSSLNSVGDKFMDGIVNAAVLPVFPSSTERLNGTFAFCASLGLKRDRVRRSIADGCFQTLKALLDSPVQHRTPLADRAMKKLRKQGRIPQITIREEKEVPKEGECPYFKKIPSTKESQRNGKMAMDEKGSPQPFVCPFYEVRQEAAKLRNHDKKYGITDLRHAEEVAEVYTTCKAETRRSELKTQQSNPRDEQELKESEKLLPRNVPGVECSL